MSGEINAIPYILHRSGPLEYDAMTERCPQISVLFQSILHRNKGYTLRYWSDDAANVFMERTFGKCNHNTGTCDCARVYDVYNRLIPGAFRADLLRYALLFVYGGVWNDLTQDYFVPLRSMIDHSRDKLVIVRDISHGNCMMNQGIQISFIACPPRLPVMKALIMRVVANVENSAYGACSLSLTGPVMASTVIRRARVDGARCEMSQDQDNIISHLREKITKRRIQYRKPCIHCRASFHNKCLPERKSKSYSDLWQTRQAIAPVGTRLRIDDEDASYVTIEADPKMSDSAAVVPSYSIDSITRVSTNDRPTIDDADPPSTEAPGQTRAFSKARSLGGIYGSTTG